MLHSMMSHKHSCSAALFKDSNCRVADTVTISLLSIVVPKFFLLLVNDNLQRFE